jgi:DNA-directed RNA polymerase specialized sigma24 family protein
LSEFVEWIGAQADAGDAAKDAAAIELPVTPESYQRSVGKSVERKTASSRLPTHNFASRPVVVKAQVPEHDWDRDPDIWIYRKKTTALLRRYMRWSLEAGRVPSLLGRELFRARISSYTATTFEARVIFLHDVEGCLDRLQDFDRQLIARVVLQEYDHEAAAQILQCARRTISRRLPELIDELSEASLKAEMLERVPETKGEMV